MRTHIEADITRGAMASQAFGDRYCSWWPATYRALLPVTSDGALLIRAKKAIEAQVKADVDAIQAEQENPWTKTGPGSTLIDWSGVKGADLLEMGLGMERGLGMPHCLKPGFENHPNVVQARANAPRTAEYVAFIAQQRAMLKYEAVNAIANAEGAAVLAGAAESTAAERELSRLRHDPRKGLAIVRPAMSEEEREAELKSISRG